MNDKGLEEFFPGEKAWKDFSSSFDEEWKECKIKDKLLGLLNGKEDLAKVIYYLEEGDSIDWIHSEIPALENQSILGCLYDVVLLKRLKTMLMRMH